MNTLLRNSFIAGLALVSLQSANAAVLAFGNNTATVAGNSVFTTTGNDDYADAFGGGGVDTSARAVGFTTGGTALTLDHVSLSLYADQVSNFQVRLLSGASPVGGTVVPGGTLTGGVGVGTTAASYNFTGSVTLAANTTYWIEVISLTGGSTWAWAKSNDGDGSAPTAYTSSGYSSPANSYTSEDQADLTVSGNTLGAETPNFAVYTTTSVPEPHEYAMIAGLGLCAFAAYRRRAALAA